MAKFMVAVSYTAEGLRGLAKDKASGRQKVVEQALASLGGKLEAMYFAFGKTDAFAICDCPDNVSAAALGLTVSASGMVRTRITPLLTVEEADQALSKTVAYRAPGA
jgi:uncharacterized protein with GYD domain